MPKTIIALGALFVLLAGCSSTPSYQVKSVPAKLSAAEKNAPARHDLISHYRTWRGVPHKMGGLNRNGIDCSGFVHVTFRDVFKKDLPRSTELLAKVGKPVPTDALKVGDLVFFKTGFKDRHVGIYTGGGQFIDASKSRGVMESSLNNPYWT